MAVMGIGRPMTAKQSSIGFNGRKKPRKKEIIMYPSDVTSAHALVLNRRCILCEHTEIAQSERKRSFNLKKVWNNLLSILWL